MPHSSAAQPTVPQLTIIAHSLARNIARHPHDVEDLVQEGLFSATRRLRKRRLGATQRPFALARTVMQRAMYTYQTGKSRATGARHREDAPLDDARPDQLVQEPDPWHSEYELTEYLDHLRTHLGDPMYRIAINLLEPQDPAYCRLLQEQVKHARRSRPNALLRPSNKLLRRALGLNRGQWRRALKTLRQFTRGWLARHYAS